jgi:hypothetical protein
VKKAASVPLQSGGILIFRVGAGRLMLRCLSVLLWRMADPQTLPVRPHGWETLRLGKSRFLSLMTLAFWSAALLVAGAGLTSWQHFRNLSLEFLRNPPGLSLESTAERIEEEAGGPWRVVNPPAARKLALLAGSVRQGQATLDKTARAYEAGRRELQDLGALARIDRARSLAGPLRAVLNETRSAWHRETMVYQELQQGLARSLDGTTPAGRRLQGRLAAVTREHALQLSVLASDGHRLGEATKALHPGDSFDLPLPADGWLLLTDLARKGQGGLEVRQEMRLPLREWTDQPIRFPWGGASVQMRFSGWASSDAAPFPKLSPGAQAELGWPVAGQR